MVATFCLLPCLNLLSTIWLEKKEIDGLIGILNQDEEFRHVDLRRDIIPLRLSKMQQIAGGISLTQGAEKYGFFVNIRDIFNLEIVSCRQPSTINNALNFCIDVFVARMHRLGMVFSEDAVDKCKACLALPLSLDRRLVYLDILLTPVVCDFCKELVEIEREPARGLKKVDKIINFACANFDLLDRNLLYNYVDPYKPLADKKQLAISELLSLRKYIDFKPDDESFNEHVFYTMVDLLRIAFALQQKKLDEVSLLFHGDPSSLGEVVEYPPGLWCTCSRVTLFERILFTANAVNDFLKRFQSSIYPNINYVSWGAGHFLQDCLIVARLMHNGYKKVSISLIDSIFCRDSEVGGHEFDLAMADVLYLDEFLLTPLSLKLGVHRDLSVYAHDRLFFESVSSAEICLLPTLITAVDVSVGYRLGNRCFDEFNTRCRENIGKLYTFTLNNHKVDALADQCI